MPDPAAALPIAWAVTTAWYVVVPPIEANVQATVAELSGAGHLYGAAPATPDTNTSTANNADLTTVASRIGRSRPNARRWYPAWMP
jgi:hypothetical protein